MADYLQNISSLSGLTNIGGLIELQIARVGDIDSIPDPVDGAIFGDIVFQPERGFVIWIVTQESPKMVSRSRNSQEGAFKDNQLTFIIPKDESVTRRMLELAEQDSFIVLFKDSNNKQKIFGTLESPVYFNFDHESGDGRGSRNQYSCSFVSDGPDNSFFYDGSIQIAPGGPLPAIVRWTDGTLIAVLQPGQTLLVDSDFEHDFEVIE